MKVFKLMLFMLAVMPFGEISAQVKGAGINIRLVVLPLLWTIRQNGRM